MSTTTTNNKKRGGSSLVDNNNNNNNVKKLKAIGDDTNTNNGDPMYLFNSNDYHPVQEYIIDSSIEKLTSSLPSFVLEVTWPRVVLVYHPTSPLCLDIQDTYVTMARYIRKRSVRVPVEFWSLNCLSYPLSCDELNVKSVPTILGYSGGQINSKLISRTKDNKIQVQSIIDAIDITLPEEDTNNNDEDDDDDEIAANSKNQQQQHALVEDNIEPIIISGEQNEEEDVQRQKHQQQIINNQQDEDMKNILHPHTSLFDVCSDAAGNVFIYLYIYI